MGDITNAVARYREAARHLWNTAFRVEAPDWDTRDRFSLVATALFDSLVLAPHGIDGPGLPPMSDPTPRHFARIAVVPVGPEAPIMMNRDASGSGSWDDPLNTVTPGAMELRFVDFFDWDELGVRDFQYVRVRVIASKAHPHLVNRYGLLEFAHVTLHAVEDAA